MTSEGVHSLVDTVNQVLLLYGIRRSTRPPDERHPLGHGRALSFWSFIVALLIFSAGAGLSFYEGIAHMFNPHGVVLAATAIFLARESKALLIGEPAREKVHRSWRRIAAQAPSIERAFSLVTVHLAPDQIVVALDLDFGAQLTAKDIEQTVQRLERRIKAARPSAIAVFAKPKRRSTQDGFRRGAANSVTPLFLLA